MRKSYSIKDIFKSVSKRIDLIVFTTIITMLLSFIFIAIKPTKYNIVHTVKINETDNPGTIDRYNLKTLGFDEFYYSLISENSIRTAYKEATGEEKPEEFYINISLDGGPRYITFSKENIDDPELYKKIITILLENELNHYIVDVNATIDVINNIDRKITEISTYIDNTNNTINNEILISNVFQLKEDKAKLQHYLDTRNNMTIPINDFLIDPIKTGKLIPLIFGCMWGVCIGILITIILMLKDKHIYTSEELQEIIDDSSFIGVIPFFKSHQFSGDALSLSYISSYIGNLGNNILITSISEYSGKSSLVKKLENDDSMNNKSINELPALNISAIPSSKIDNNTDVIVLVAAGRNTLDEVNLINKEFIKNKVKCHYILNLVTADDNQLLHNNTANDIYSIGNFTAYAKFYKKHTL